MVNDLNDFGRLQVGTFALNIGSPIDNALITVTRTGGEQVVLEEMISDSSGRSAVIELEAPPIEFSLSPDEPKPYSEYDVKVSVEGFRETLIEGVQILPNTTAVQDIMLSPMLGPDMPPEDIEIDPHTLWGVFPPKVPEDEIKPLPPAQKFVVLPDPVIPEFIVVHDGLPSDVNAPNYWIPFQDYIKNVACCEIYATWPDSTIRANVLAILSFTLNRVYTEWYRSKGYNFTITSTTSLDHAFSYGRNIYDRISMIVDEIFTTFITRPGARQPLLTQYCDGRRSTCPGWMTQWGSMDLGSQGFDALTILRSFYGHDIFLMQANKVAGVPISFPGSNLQLGSTGQAVSTIQEQLNEISNVYTAIQKLRVDGIFGVATRIAVETFQSIFNLPPSGIVDFATWYRISNVYIAVSGLAGL
ncbi:MAG: peptidoglycan-binding protein [Anaerovoracaceae bacterium]|jgi:peptidoglycan hydrolase-like protein with peptidoglycan-binding domain